jgi:hypothetical protein
MFTIYVFQGDNFRSWLVDYQIGGTLSNWRELTGSLQPAGDLSFSFSNNPATPHIAYVANGSQIVRINTETMTLANTGNFPHTATTSADSYWMHTDKNDQWFVWHATSGGQVKAWNSTTDSEIAQTWSGMNEPRFERGGRYVMLSGQPAFRIWDLQTNTLGAQKNLGPMAHNASLDGYFVATDWDYGGYNRLDAAAQTFTDIGDRMVFDGYETHLCGAWLQGSGAGQWFTATSMGNGGWPASNVMAHYAVALVKADGSDARLVAHTHSNTSTDYWSLPFANIGPSGHLVIWTSHNSTNGTNAVGDYALYVAEVPRR